MFMKAFQKGRSERRNEAHSLPYVEPLNDAGTTLEDFFNILLGVRPEIPLIVMAQSVHGRIGTFTATCA